MADLSILTDHTPEPQRGGNNQYLVNEGVEVDMGANQGMEVDAEQKEGVEMDAEQNEEVDAAAVEIARAEMNGGGGGDEIDRIMDEQ
ncbi:hypothetical protein ACA910_014787 [Epithemia clementina (nom. ined.)]